jgi:hypothetical protein
MYSQSLSAAGEGDTLPEGTAGASLPEGATAAFSAQPARPVLNKSRAASAIVRIFLFISFLLKNHFGELFCRGMFHGKPTGS